MKAQLNQQTKSAQKSSDGNFNASHVSADSDKVLRQKDGISQKSIKLNRVEGQKETSPNSFGLSNFKSISILPTSSFPLQPKLKINSANDKYEQEADRVAEQVMQMPVQSVQLKCKSCGHEEEVTQAPKIAIQRKCSKCENEDEVIQTKSNGGGQGVASNGLMNQIRNTKGGGQSLDSTTKTFMESRIGENFGNVRIHNDNRSAGMNQEVNARAFTVGNDIYFNRGQYSPSSANGRKLLAHELTHVVQQNSSNTNGGIGLGNTSSLIQRSELSDSIRDSFKVDSSLESLLTRLSQSDVQSAQSDTDVDKELIKLLAGRTDDLWLAQQIRRGQLVENSGTVGPQKMPKQPIKAHFFQGTTNRRALVIAGVHGSEVQGVEVVNHMIEDLKKGSQKIHPELPLFSVILVPELFPDNVKARRRQLGTATNRNFPEPHKSLSDVSTDTKGRPLAAPTDVKGAAKGVTEQKPILTENILLMSLMERFKPERIISVHGTWRAGAGGVFYDPRNLTDAEKSKIDLKARQYAQGMAYMSVAPDRQDTEEGKLKMQELEKRFYHEKYFELAEASGKSAKKADENLSLRTAKEIDKSTDSITGREGRNVANREGEPKPVSKDQIQARKDHPSVAGNVGKSGDLDTAYWSGDSPSGYSLGGYASGRGMSIFTVEPPLNCNEADYKKGGSCAGESSKVDAAERKLELKSYAKALRLVLLGLDG